MPQVRGEGAGEPGVVGTSQTEDGVLGIANVSYKAGVAGVNDKGGNGLFGRGHNGIVGQGFGEGGSGVVGSSDTGDGLLGLAKAQGKAGVAGVNENIGNGVYGRGHNGVYGHGTGDGGSGVVGTSDTGDAVLGIAKVNFRAGVAGVNDHGGNGMYAVGHTGIFAQSNAPGGGLAGNFRGDVEVTGDLRLTNADGAELFDVGEPEIEPGSVVILDENGAIVPSSSPYDRRAVGIVSGAGSYRPGIVLDNRETGAVRLPVAVFGKVFCKVDARPGPVSIGDLMCTSGTRGHAMRAADRSKAFGAVVGKALAPLTDGIGLVPVLVALQ